MTIEEVLEEMKRRYPHDKAVTADTLDAMVDDLADIPLPALALICRQLWRSRKFFPGVAEIREAYIDAVLPDKWIESFRWTVTAMSTGETSPYTGRTRMPTEWPDALTRETVEAIGWSVLYTLNDYNRRHVFEAQYKGLRNERIAAANRESMDALGVAALGEGDELRIVQLTAGKPGPPARYDAITGWKLATNEDADRAQGAALVTDDHASHRRAADGACFCGICGREVGEPHRVQCAFSGLSTVPS